MSDEAIVNMYVETNFQVNATKYCPNCNQKQHCNHSITYARTRLEGVVPDAFIECETCECMDCTGET